MLDAVEWKYPTDKTNQTLDVFKDMQKIERLEGKEKVAAFVSGILDLVEKRMKLGVVYYNSKGTILHDRTSVAEALFRDHRIFVMRGAIRDISEKA